MPRTQTAVVGNYHIGATAAQKVCLLADVRQDLGGNANLSFEFAAHENPVAITVQTWDASLTTPAWADTAIAAVTVVARGIHRANVVLRAGVDTRMRVLATGPGRMDMSIRGDDALTIREKNAASALS